MSIDLTLVVLNSREDIGAAFRPAASRMEFPVKIRVLSSASMVDQIATETFETVPVPRAFRLEGSFMSGEIDTEPYSTDAYGKPLRYCYPTAFSDIALDPAEHPFNKAALAYILALPDDWPVVLYWS